MDPLKPGQGLAHNVAPVAAAQNGLGEPYRSDAHNNNTAIDALQ